MGCCIFWPKSLVFIINAFFLTCGIIITTLTIWMVNSPDNFVATFGHPDQSVDKYRSLQEAQIAYVRTNFSQTHVYVAMGFGICLMIVSLYSASGIVNGHSCSLFTFNVLILAILLVQIGVGVLIIVCEDEVDIKVRKWLVEVLTGAYEDLRERNALSFTFDEIFIFLHCCGINDARDFQSLNVTGKSRWAPNSCCYHLRSDGTKINCSDFNYEEREGCYRKIFVALNSDKVALTITIFSVIAIEILAIAAGFYLVRKSTLIKKYYNR